MATALSVEQLFDSLAIRVNGPRAWQHSLTLDWDLTDLRERYRMTLHNGVLVHHRQDKPADTAPDVTFTLTKPDLMALLAGRSPEDLKHTGDPSALRTLQSVLDSPTPTWRSSPPETARSPAGSRLQTNMTGTQATCGLGCCADQSEF
jgi:alkyl sulfatase BDS1-like metallo-beta-lactamase superfamily hydrolase